MTHFLTAIVTDLVDMANPGRDSSNLHRRIHKWFEEFGELEQAYLSLTSPSNHRGLALEDVREEACDVLIVALDVALTKITNNFKINGLARSLAEFAIHPVTSKTPCYDDLTMNAVTAVCQYAANFQNHPELADFLHGHTMVLYCFAIVDFVYSDIPQGIERDTAIIEEIKRKLAKWMANREAGRVATDAE